MDVNKGISKGIAIQDTWTLMVIAFLQLEPSVMTTMTVYLKSVFFRKKKSPFAQSIVVTTKTAPQATTVIFGKMIDVIPAGGHPTAKPTANVKPVNNA